MPLPEGWKRKAWTGGYSGSGVQYRLEDQGIVRACGFYVSVRGLSLDDNDIVFTTRESRDRFLEILRRAWAQYEHLKCERNREPLSIETEEGLVSPSHDATTGKLGSE